MLKEPIIRYVSGIISPNIIRARLLAGIVSNPYTGKLESCIQLSHFEVVCLTRLNLKKRRKDN